MLGETLAVLRTDAQMFAVPSPAFGVLTKKCALPGEAIEAGEPLAVLGGVPPPLSPSEPEPIPVLPTYRSAGPETIHALSAQEVALAEHHRRSLRDTPHAYAVLPADIGEALLYIAKTRRGETVSGAPESLSLLPFVLSAVASALLQFPELNAERSGNTEIRRKQYVHIGVETQSTEGGLLVPVLREVDHKSVLAIAREWVRLRDRIADRTMPLDAVSGATFIVSETPRVSYRTPILHHPLAGHLSFGKPANDQVYLCLAYDAAIVSGNAAEAFIAAVADHLSEARFLFA